ncbi:MAG: glycosyltransferase family 2 protein, partial [bacterium]|nr:glycosyltransferase family 2 protein [bacterium]
FSVSAGSIIGRIDADSVLDQNWVKKVTEHFDKDNQLYGLTGIGLSALVPFYSKPKTTLWTRVYYWMVRASFRTATMWGATMAVRRQAWQIVEKELNSNDQTVHEDQDFSLCMAYHGLKIREFNDVKIIINGQTYRFLPKFWRYAKMQRYTLRLHKKRGTFRSRRFPRLSLGQILPGLLIALPASVYLMIFGVLLPYPIDLFMIKFKGSSKWLGNSSN